MKKDKFNINTLIRDNIKRMKPYASARSEFKSMDANMIYLDANENPFENGLNRYPDPQQISLKSVLAEQKGVQIENILLGNGSDEILDLIFRVFCEPAKDNVITLPPTFGIYDVLANTNNIENRKILLNDDFQPRIDAILAEADTNSKLLFICSPNNPTGNTIDNKSITKLLNSFNGLIIIDEAYIDFSQQESWISKLNDYPNLIITQTLSKAYGLAGIRLGICYASKEIIVVLNKIKLPYNINELTQKRALDKVLKTKEIKNEIASILNEKRILLKELLKVSFIQKIYPTDANFILIKVDNANKRYQQLIEKGIVLRNRTTQSLLENCLRITIGTKDENEKLIKTFLLISKC
ncbi:MAG: histidinol-phosphate transaminase [Flavobacteriaceae bacterium]|nr:histidinol-phosphate transaminase [Flavobacteriaceae bacterium]